MAKTDFFRLLGCLVMLTLILVIAVKLSKQCMYLPLEGFEGFEGFRGVCPAGKVPNQSGTCVTETGP